MKTFTLILAFFTLSFTNFAQTTRIITDFGGYWSSTTALPNSVRPDSSHMLLGFTFNGVTYSTGVNDGVLISNSVPYTPGNWQAFPVSDIVGDYGPGAGGGIACYIALANRVDRSPSSGNIPAVSDYSIRTALIDGVKGLDLGTGVTNLPTTAVMNFKIFNIDPTKIDDDEPDILLTQIADPTNPVNDQFSLRDAAGNQVGNTFVQDMTTLTSFGTYTLDLFNLTPNTPYNAATVYSTFQAHNNPVGTVRTRPIRVVAIKLSAFGITPANVGQVASLRVAPSGISDYAFIAYNTNSISLTPNISQNPPLTNVSVCAAGTAHFSVLATAAEGGELTYSWEESSDAGSSWHSVTDGGNYAGAITDRLAVTAPVHEYMYRVTVIEAGNPNPVTSEVFQVNVITDPGAPTSVAISGGSTVCAGTPVQLTSAVTGGSNLFYEWQVDPTGSGTFQAIPDANLSTYVPPAGQTGAMDYRLRISSGSACLPELISNTQAITISGISSVAPDEICGPGIVNLSATATSGDINWYTDDVGGSPVATGLSYSPNLSNTTTYYIASTDCPGALRVPVTATISSASTGGTITGSTTVVSATNSTTLTLSGISGAVIKWQSSTDDFNTVITDIAHTAPQLTVTNLTETTKYRAEIQSGSCATAFSSIAAITVSGTLPIHSASVKATRVDDGVEIRWTAYDQENTDRFEVERSRDGITYTKIYTTLPTGNINSEITYNWVDEHPGVGTNFYRIKEVYQSGNHEYSSIVQVMYETGNSGIAIYPNPIADRNLVLRFSDMSAGAYRVRIINNIGQIVDQMAINHSGGSRSQSLKLSQKIAKGLYKVEILKPAGARKTYSILIL